MNALFLKDLAQKTRRGLEGRVRQGRSGGGLCYGYEVVQERAPDGSPIRGGRRIDPDRGEHRPPRSSRSSPLADPRGQSRTSSMRKALLGRSGDPGDHQRSTATGGAVRAFSTTICTSGVWFGIGSGFPRTRKPANELQSLTLRLNGSSRRCPNFGSSLTTLWTRVKERQAATRSILIKDHAGVRAERARRPSYLLSGLLKCGSCGGGVSKISQEHYGCSNARNRGTCDNRLTIRRDVLEESVLAGLKANLMHPDLVKEFVAEYHREINRLAAARDGDRDSVTQDLAIVERGIHQIIDAIKSGVRSATMANELIALESRKLELERRLAASRSRRASTAPESGRGLSPEGRGPARGAEPGGCAARGHAHPPRARSTKFGSCRQTASSASTSLATSPRS